MTFSKQFPLLLFFSISPLLNATEPKRCFGSLPCTGDKFGILFPFWLSPDHPSSCGYPGFELYCTDHHETALNLPNSGPYLVQEIDHLRQRILLNDPDNCLARRLLSFNSSKSPFSPLHLFNYTFFTCPTKGFKSSFFKPIHCLSNSTTSFFATPFELAGAMPSSCQVFKTLLLPVSSPLFADLNDQDLWLKWDTPDCRECYNSAPLCGFVNNTTLQVKCFVYIESGNPWLITLKKLCYYLSFLFLGIIITALCLNCPSIKQAKTVELAESKSILTRNDTLCAICLSECASQNSHKCLPECEHCFHTDCIDPWLQVHNSCPVCRNSPFTSA